MAYNGQTMARNLLINISLAIGSVALFVLLIEFGLRITGLQSATPNPPKIYRSHENPNISYELIPNLKREKAYRSYVSTDEHGFRLNGDKQESVAKEESMIAVLGDSITFGYGVQNDQTLAAELQKQSGIPFLNAAVSGYQLQQQTAAYIEKVQPLNPAGILLVFYWNDLDGYKPGILDEHGILRPNAWKPSRLQCKPITEGILGYLPGKCWLDLNSAFYKAFRKLYSLQASKNKQQEEREADHDEAPQNPITAEKLSWYERDIEKLARHIPNNRTFVIWPDNFLHSETRPKLKAIAEKNGFTVIDLYDLFGNTVETLAWDTVHPNPKSIKDAATFILETYEKQ